MLQTGSANLTITKGVSYPAHTVGEYIVAVCVHAIEGLSVQKYIKQVSYRMFMDCIPNPNYQHTLIGMFLLQYWTSFFAAFSVLSFIDSIPFRITR